MTEKESEAFWTQEARRQLLGRKIVGVRYMGRKEADDIGFIQRPVLLELDDGNLVYPSRDDEGNDAGALFTNDQKSGTLPVL